MTAAIEVDTCETCGHPVTEFEDHGFQRVMVGTCDDCSACYYANGAADGPDNTAAGHEHWS